MDWNEHLHSAPGVAGGHLVIRGTRMRADFLLGLFGQGWTVEQVLESYPHLTPEQLRAVFAYAADALQDETYLRPAA